MSTNPVLCMAHLVYLGLGHEELRQCRCVLNSTVNERHCLCHLPQPVTVLGQEMDNPELH